MAYSYDQLQQLWISSGGASAVAGLMAAIGLAESGGDPGAVNSSSGACGLWQIHPAEAGCLDPQQNAQMAVRKYNDQGLGAWEAYTNGSYRKYQQGDSAPASAMTLSSTGGSCAYSFPLFGQTLCVDGLLGGGAALGGLVVLALGLISLAGEFR